MSDPQPNDGGPAFPTPGYDERHSDGMSLRDWLAGMAMQGLLSNQCRGDLSYPSMRNTLCDESYAISDAMLKAREK